MSAAPPPRPAGTVLITGASRGIGYELARRFARAGHDLVLVARDRDALSRAAGELAPSGVSVRTISCDLARPGSPSELFQEIQQQSVAVEVLVNNAGFGTFGPFAEGELATELEMMQLNVISLTHLTKLFLREMLPRGRGRILNVASTAAFQPGPLMAVYFATKAHVLSFSEALANELRGSGVTVSVLCPGPTRSGFQERAGMERSRLFRWGVMDAAVVADAAYEGLMSGRTLIIPGLKNKLLAFSVRLGPRALIPHIVRKLQEEEHADP